jgi:uncharacterized protein
VKAPRLLELTKLMVVGARLPLTRTPEEAGLAFEDVEFTATDGVSLRGWFVPGPGDGPKPAVVWVHGWLWNRMGNVAGRVPFTDRDVDFLPPTKALHEAGYSVLMFDLSNHGESGARLPLTFGPWEARDYMGAVAYLRSRDDVDPDRIGAIGTSMGGNVVLLGSSYVLPIKAALLVQPTRPYAFSAAFAADVMGKLGSSSLPMVDVSYVVARAPRPSTIDPAESARKLHHTTLKYVQGTGDPWGSMDIVQDFVDASPHALPLLKYPSTGRYEGYRYVTEQAADVAAFFGEYL